MVTPTECQYCTYCHLNISHGMVQTGTDNTHHLVAGIHNLQTSPLVIMFIPFLGAMSHLGSIIQSKREVLETTMSGDSPHLNKVLEGQSIKGPLRTPQTLRSLVYVFGLRIRPMRIIAGSTGILVVVGSLELLEALYPGVIDILGEGDESR